MGTVHARLMTLAHVRCYKNATYRETNKRHEYKYKKTPELPGVFFIVRL